MTAAIVWLEPPDGLFEGAIDAACDNSAQFKITKFFYLRLLVVFSYCALAESGQKNASIYKNNNIAQELWILMITERVQPWYL